MYKIDNSQLNSISIGVSGSEMSAYSTSGKSDDPLLSWEKVNFEKENSLAIQNRTRINQKEKK